METKKLEHSDLHHLKRQGIGSLLMRELQTHCRNLGYKMVFVQADAVDEHALNFYEKIGGVREDVFHFDFPVEGRYTSKPFR